MKTISGLTSATPSKLLLDAGAFFKNYDFTKTYDQNAAKLIGATSGGGSFSAVPTVRQIAVDGAKTNVEELEVIDGWVVTMVANVKEVVANSLQLALGAAESGTPASTDTALSGYTMITGKESFEAEDYADNIVWVGRLSGKTNPVIIVLNNALSLNGLSLTMADKAEATIPITLTGHYSLDDLDTPPFSIYYPGT